VNGKDEKDWERFVAEGLGTIARSIANSPKNKAAYKDAERAFDEIEALRATVPDDVSTIDADEARRLVGELIRISGDLQQGYLYMFGTAITAVPRYMSRKARSSAAVAHLGSAKTQAMIAVRFEFNRWQDGEVVYRNDSDFARRMQTRYPIISNEASIKNNCSRWRKQRASLS